MRRGIRWRSSRTSSCPTSGATSPRKPRASGHGGGDYLQVDDFVDAIVEGKEPPIGIHQSMDMTLVGLASQLSIAKGSVWVDVPDSREW